MITKWGVATENWGAEVEDFIIFNTKEEAEAYKSKLENYKHLCFINLLDSSMIDSYIKNGYQPIYA